VIRYLSTFPSADTNEDYEGLYICTNLAMLCEEILGVLEAGKSFQNSKGDVIVVCNIEHQDNWNYFTEPGALRRIAVNLIGNALKYTEKGSVVVTLDAIKVVKNPYTISNDLTTGRTMIMTIRDTGRGMSKEFMDNQLFLPFTQEDTTSSHGVGLGMSIVKSLVSLLSGQIHVQSEPDEGTQITVKIPMKMCDSENNEKGQTSLDFEQTEKMLRDRKLSAVIYGFPPFVRDSLTNYLRNWFGCTLLDPTNDARPDIVLVDEGNEEVLEAVQETAHAYGKHGVLLSIVMKPNRLGKRMELTEGYIKWERVPRPLGPNNVAQGLLSCLDKLDELRKYGEDASVDRQEISEQPQPRKGPVNIQELKDSLPGDLYMPSLEKLQISEASQDPSESSESRTPSPGSAKPSTDKKLTAASNQTPNNFGNYEVDPKVRPSGILRILIVDDNALNLRLLGAFFKKSGYRNVQQAKHGREAVEAVQNCSEGFDIIFMGTWTFTRLFLQIFRD
jgi:CheY-like chemotaxis protein